MSEQLVASLSDPQAWPEPPAEVGFLQTHISLLFFVGPRVYKIKKAVDLGFLDFRDLDVRSRMCGEELRLNRRLAPDTYLGVVAVRRRDDGSLRVDALDAPEEAPGEVVDWAVLMRRLPTHRMLDCLLDAGDLDNDMVQALAELLVDFHARVPTGDGVDGFGSVAAVRGNCEENFAQTEGAETLSPALHAFLRARASGFIDDNRALLERRVAEGRIRDGHGDLHAGNICMTEDGIVVYDCLEFAPRYRCADVAADLAFLVMDLDLRRLRAFGEYLVRSYVARGGDAELPALMRFYKGYRAFVRGKVATLQLAQAEDDDTRTELRATAAHYFHLGASYELPPALILCCGLPGSGKSFLGTHIARPFEAALLNSDQTRKRLAGIPPAASAGSDLYRGNYGPAATRETYAVLLAAARGHLARGRTVVIDAGLRSAEQRQPFRALAAELGVPIVLVHVDTDEATTLQRLGQRARDARAVSDAGVRVYYAVRERFEPPDEFAEDELVVDDGVGPPEDATRAVIDRLVAQVQDR